LTTCFPTRSLERDRTAVDRDMVDVDASLGQQLLDTPARQAEAAVPAHRCP
jgi:hypothetical protein